jgi:hypothetical protein
VLEKRMHPLARVRRPVRIITLINIAIKRLITSGYPAGYLTGDCLRWQRMGGMT